MDQHHPKAASRWRGDLLNCLDSHRPQRRIVGGDHALRISLGPIVAVLEFMAFRALHVAGGHAADRRVVGGDHQRRRDRHSRSSAHFVQVNVCTGSLEHFRVRQ